MSNQQSNPDTIILSKTSSTGLTIEVRLHEYTAGNHIAQTYVDGKYTGSGASKPQRLNKAQGAITHWLGGKITDGKGAIGLTADEAKQINDAIGAADASWEASATGQVKALGQERARLVRVANALLANSRDVINRAMDSERDPGAAFGQSSRLQGEAEAAREQLAAFDAAHPEIKAAIDAERSERTARHMWD